MKNYEVAIYTDLQEVTIYVVRDCTSAEGACRRACTQWRFGYGCGNIREIIVREL